MTEIFILDSQSKARTSNGAIYVVAQGCSSRSASSSSLSLATSLVAAPLPDLSDQGLAKLQLFPIYTEKKIKLQTPLLTLVAASFTSWLEPHPLFVDILLKNKHGTPTFRFC
jgi:hypothetical protein